MQRRTSSEISHYDPTQTAEFLEAYLGDSDVGGVLYELRRDKNDDTGALKKGVLYRYLKKTLDVRRTNLSNESSLPLMDAEGKLTIHSQDRNLHFIAVTIDDLQIVNKEGGHTIGDAVMTQTVTSLNSFVESILAEDVPRDPENLPFGVYHIRGADFMIAVDTTHKELFIGDIEDVLTDIDGLKIAGEGLPGNMSSATSLSRAEVTLQDGIRMFNELQEKLSQMKNDPELQGEIGELVQGISTISEQESEIVVKRLMLGTVDFVKEVDKLNNIATKMAARMSLIKETEAARQYYENYVKNEFGGLEDSPFKDFDSFNSLIADGTFDPEILKEHAFKAVAKRFFDSVELECVEDQIVTAMIVYQGALKFGNEEYSRTTNGPFADYLRNIYQSERVPIFKGWTEGSSLTESDTQTQRKEYLSSLKEKSGFSQAVLSEILESRSITDPQAIETIENLLDFDYPHKSAEVHFEKPVTIFRNGVYQVRDHATLLEQGFRNECKLFDNPEYHDQILAVLEKVKSGSISDVELRVLASLSEVIRCKMELFDYRFDDLTGLPTREEYLKDDRAWIRESLEKGQNLNLAFVDLGFLKYFNRVGGRALGDKAISEAAVIFEYVAEMLNNEFGLKAKAYRYGGDEFVIMFEEGEITAYDGTKMSAKEVFEQAIADLRSSCGRIMMENSGVDYEPQLLRIDFGISDTTVAQEVLDRLLAEKHFSVGDQERLIVGHENYDPNFHAAVLARLINQIADAQLENQKEVSRLTSVVTAWDRIQQLPDGQRELEMKKFESILPYSGKALSGLGMKGILEAFSLLKEQDLVNNVDLPEDFDNLRRYWIEVNTKLDTIKNTHKSNLEIKVADMQHRYEGSPSEENQMQLTELQRDSEKLQDAFSVMNFSEKLRSIQYDYQIEDEEIQRLEEDLRASAAEYGIDLGDSIEQGLKTNEDRLWDAIHDSVMKGEENLERKQKEEAYADKLIEDVIRLIIHRSKMIRNISSGGVGGSGFRGFMPSNNLLL